MPKTVKPPLQPAEIETVEELCFTGLRLEQIYNPSLSPLSYYQEAIQRAPQNAFANIRIGSWYLKEGIFQKAEHHLQTAADRWTTDYTRAKDGEVFYLLGLSQLALGKENEAQQSFYKATWDYGWYGSGHLQLALLESKAGNYSLALDQNVRLARAYVLQGLGQWGQGNKAEAEHLFEEALKHDPSNFEAKTRLFL